MSFALLPLLFSSIQSALPPMTRPSLHRLITYTCLSPLVLLVLATRRSRSYLLLITMVFHLIIYVFHGYTMVILSFVFLTMFYLVSKKILESFPGSFTIGEASIISQLICAMSLESLYMLTTAMQQQAHHLVADNQMILDTFYTLVLGSLLIIMATATMAQRIRLRPVQSTADVATFYVIAAAIILFILTPALAYVSGGHLVFTWLIGYLLTDPMHKLALLAYWIALLAVTLAFFTPKQGTFTPNIILRKYFHLLAIAMFLPAIIFQPALLVLSFGVAIAALLLIELLKYGKVPPLGPALSLYMDAFLDARDAGIVTLTHIYLLLGCSMPVVLTFIYNTQHQTIINTLHPLSPYAGLLTIGVGDSAASYIGVKYGKTRWFGTSKSLQGTLAFILSTFIAGTTLICLVLPTTSISIYISLVKLLIGSILGGLIEASTTQIDNLILPLIFFSLINS
eukprot:gene6244-7236_t